MEASSSPIFSVHFIYIGKVRFHAAMMTFFMGGTNQVTWTKLMLNARGMTVSLCLAFGILICDTWPAWLISILSCLYLEAYRKMPPLLEISLTSSPMHTTSTLTFSFLSFLASLVSWVKKYNKFTTYILGVRVADSNFWNHFCARFSTHTILYQIDISEWISTLKGGIQIWSSNTVESCYNHSEGNQNTVCCIGSLFHWENYFVYWAKSLGADF